MVAPIFCFDFFARVTFYVFGVVVVLLSGMILLPKVLPVEKIQNKSTECYSKKTWFDQAITTFCAGRSSDILMENTVQCVLWDSIKIGFTHFG